MPPLLEPLHVCIFDTYTYTMLAGFEIQFTQGFELYDSLNFSNN